MQEVLKSGTMHASELYLCNSHLFLISEPHVLPGTSSSMEAILPAVPYLVPLVGFFKRLPTPEGGEQAEGMSCFQ